MWKESSVNSNVLIITATTSILTAISHQLFQTTKNFNIATVLRRNKIMSMRYIIVNEWVIIVKGNEANTTVHWYLNFTAE